MAHTKNLDEVHRAIGEFVVFFQSVEDFYRSLGWTLLDPERKAWPPQEFRKESNRDLIDKVTDLFLNLIDSHAFPNGTEKATEAEQLRKMFHDLRRFRNRIVHSAYHEVMGGGEVMEIQRSNPRLLVDPETGEIAYDQEPFEPERVTDEIGKHAQAFFKLHALRMQVIHWHPFSRYAR